MYSPQVSIEIRSQPCDFQHRSGNKRKERVFYDVIFSSFQCQIFDKFLIRRAYYRCWKFIKNRNFV